MPDYSFHCSSTFITVAPPSGKAASCRIKSAAWPDFALHALCRLQMRDHLQVPPPPAHPRTPAAPHRRQPRPLLLLCFRAAPAGEPVALFPPQFCGHRGRKARRAIVRSQEKTGTQAAEPALARTGCPPPLVRAGSPCLGARSVSAQSEHGTACHASALPLHGRSRPATWSCGCEADHAVARLRPAQTPAQTGVR
jgi:hypothetical protein